jgi:hypothetical protein
VRRDSGWPRGASAATLRIRDYFGAAFARPPPLAAACASGCETAAAEGTAAEAPPATAQSCADEPAPDTQQAAPSSDNEELFTWFDPAASTSTTPQWADRRSRAFWGLPGQPRHARTEPKYVGGLTGWVQAEPQLLHTMAPEERARAARTLPGAPPLPHGFWGTAAIGGAVASFFFFLAYKTRPRFGVDYDEEDVAREPVFKWWSLTPRVVEARAEWMRKPEEHRAAKPKK